MMKKTNTTTPDEVAETKRVHKENFQKHFQ